MAVSFYPLESSAPAGSDFTRNSTAYFRPNAGTMLTAAGINVPVFEYDAALGGSAYVSEPEAQNLATAPENFVDAAWVHEQAGPDVSVDADIGIAPTEKAKADRLNFLTASSDTGLSQIIAPAGGALMVSLYIQQDSAPHDFRLRRPDTDVGAVDGVATPTWQRVSMLQEVSAALEGVYLRRNAGNGGALRLWGAHAHTPRAAKLLSYHPTIRRGDSFRVPNAALDGAQGTVGFEWQPGFDAASERNEAGWANDPLAESTLMSFHEDGLRLAWASDVADPVEPHLRLYNDGAVVAAFYTRHVLGDRLRVRVHFGGSESRAHLEVNGVLIKASVDWVEFVPPQYTYVGCLPTGGQCYARYRRLSMDTERLTPVERFASLGDDLSIEPYVASSKSWNRRAGELLEPVSKQILVAGVAGDEFADMLARVQDDIVDQGVDTCVILGGHHDLIEDATLVEMQSDAQDIFDALAAAGIRVVVGTITPFKAHADWTAGREAVRVGFNAWLGAGALNVDLLVDTAAVVADGGDPELLAAAYDSGDGLRFNDAGGTAIANAIIGAASPPTGIDNPSFEIPGTSSGLAEGWSFTRVATVEEFAAFDTTSSAVEDFGSEWRLPNTWGPYENEFSLFSFRDESDLESAEFLGLAREDFEFGWDNDAGFIDDLDAVSTQAFSVDTTPAEDVEDYEEEWDNNETSRGALEDFIDSDTDAPFTIVLNSNDQIRVDRLPTGSAVFTATLAAGAYATTAAMAVQLQSAIDAAIAGFGGAPGDIVVEVGPSGYVRIRTVNTDQIRFRELASRSAWASLGFEDHPLADQLWHFRPREGYVLEAAGFDPGDPEDVEDYEEQWRDNEYAIFAFVDITHLVAASFDVGVPELFEDFQEEWTLALTL